jgi:hypothetical protein
MSADDPSDFAEMVVTSIRWWMVPAALAFWVAVFWWFG